MLSEKEKQFMEQWEKERDVASTFSHKLFSGLPMAALFSFPVALFIGIVYVFFPDWYAKVSHIGAGSFVMMVIALFIAMIFFAYFRMSFKWEMNEQLYQELKQRQRINA